MKGKKYTKNEIILCTYIARFGRGLITEEMISDLERRSIASIKMKIQNIVDMLDRAGIPRSSDGTPLSGKPPGQTGRWTNWEIVTGYCNMNKTEMRNLCMKLL